MGLLGDARQLRSNERAPYCDHGDCEERASWKVQCKENLSLNMFKYYCGTHYLSLTAKKSVPAECESCRRLDDLTPTRRWDEGLNGPKYKICQECIPSYVNPPNDDWDDQEANEEDI